MDDLTIDGEETLYRRVQGNNTNTIFDSNQDRWRPSSAAFEIRDDGMSVFLASIVEAHALTPADVAHGHPGYHVAQVFVHQCRQLSLGVVGDPIDPPHHPCDPAHALVRGDGSRQQLKKTSSKLAKQAVFVIGP